MIQPPPCRPPLHEDPLMVYSLFRERTVQEDAIINHRMSWFIFMNAVLLAFIGAVISQKLISGDCKTGSFAIEWVSLFSCLVGWLISLGTLGSIIAALMEISHLVRIYEKRYPAALKMQEEGKIPFLIGHGPLHFFGHVIDVSAPFLMLFVWPAIALMIDTSCVYVPLPHK